MFSRLGVISSLFCSGKLQSQLWDRKVRGFVWSRTTVMEPLLLLWLWDVTVVIGRQVVGGSAAAVCVYNNCATVFLCSLSDEMIATLIFLYI